MSAVDPYRDALERLSASAPTLINDVALAATDLGDTLATFPGTVARGEEALRRFDEQLDELVVPLLAIIASGSQDDLRVLTLAIAALADAASGPTRPHRPFVLAVLSRAAFALTAGALAWRRLDVVEQIAGVTRSDGYGPPVSVLSDTDLRHLDLFDRGADETYNSHVAWLLTRPWRGSVGALHSDQQSRIACAEADVLTGMLTVGEGRDRDLYAAGLRFGDRRVEDRLIARVNDRQQRPQLARLFGVAENDLRTRMADAYAGLYSGNHSRRRPLFATD